MATPFQEPSPLRRAGYYVLLVYGISWLIWIGAQLLGAGPGRGEAALGIGTAGPAIAAMVLSRAGRRRVGYNAALRWTVFGVTWAACWRLYAVTEALRASAHLSLISELSFAPLAAVPAWIVASGFGPDEGVATLLQPFGKGRDWRWPLIALLAVPLLLVGPLPLARALGLPIAVPHVAGPIGAMVAYGCLMFSQTLFFTATLEEPGWRAFLYPTLRSRVSPLAAILVIWPIWAAWHAPLDYEGWVGQSVSSYVLVRWVASLPLGTILVWLYERSGRSLLTVTLFHAGINAFPLVLPYSPLALFSLYLWAVVAVVYDRMWRAVPETVSP